MKRITSFLCGLIALSSCAVNSEWQSENYRSHALVGKIWDVAAARFVERAELVTAALEVDYVLLGEKHDNPDHHLLRAELLSELAHSARLMSLTFEHITRQQESVIRSGPWKNLEDMAVAMQWDKTGWPPFQIFKPLFKAGLTYRMSLVPGGLDREEMREIVAGENPSWNKNFRSEFGLNDELSLAMSSSLQRELQVSHCDMLPAAAVPKMIAVQRVWDAYMAQQLLTAKEGGLKVLLAGNGHVRTDRGVPLYLRKRNLQAEILSVALLEVRPGLDRPSDYSAFSFSTTLPYDYVWFTPLYDKEDPCKKFLEQHAFGK